MSDQVWSFSMVSNANLCQKNRGFNFETKDTNLPENYYRKQIIIACIKAALKWNERNPDNIMQYLNERYDECGYKNFQQRQMNLAWDHKRIMRYLNNETRIPVAIEGGQVDMGGTIFNVRPDMCFVDDKTKSIELVRIQLGRPKLTNRGKKNAAVRDIKLFSMIMYGRQLGYQNIVASIYYLQKTTDVIGGLAGQNFDPDFFEGGGGNIVSISDQYMGSPTSLDKEVEQALNELNHGIEPTQMLEEDCKSCPKYDICQYTMPPVKLIEEEKAVKDLSHLKLTVSQQQAVNINQGIWRINAGAGAGKTMVVALRTVNLLNQGVKPEEILMITFTNAGAKEMMERIQLCYEQFGQIKNLDLSAMKICTFNSFGDTVIGDNYPYLGFNKKPKIIDNVERYSIIAKILNAHPIADWVGESFLYFNSTQKNAKGALAIVGDIFKIIKSMGGDHTTVTYNDVKSAIMDSDIPSSAVQAAINLYPIFDKELKDHNLIEYTDQEILPFKIFETIPDYLQNRFMFKHIIVDEFQDSNVGQISLIKILRQLPTFQSLMVVGDDSQAIFGFRETSPEYIIKFAEYMGEPVNDIFLVENHRSTPQIIDFANKINSLNHEKVDKDLVATRPAGKPVTVQCFYSKEDEYNFIAEGIKDHLAAGVRPESIAVIAYTKSELQALADLLTKNNIPSVMAAPERLMSNSRIRAILAFGRVLCDPKNTKDALICANAMVGGAIMDLPAPRIQQLLDNVLLRVNTILGAASLQAKKEGFISFIDAIAMDDETVEAFKESLANKEYGEILQYCADFALYGADVEFRRLSNYPGVVLSTAHSSKGLEWPVVYNTLSRYQTGARVYEETRRLVFVSATRARDELYISGVYAAFGKTYKTRQYNNYLKECCEILGVDFDPHYAN